MNLKVENVEKNVVKLEIEVDDEKFREGINKAYLKNKKKFNIPGFRKGKAPRHIIENYYGEQVFYEDMINIICPEEYDKAVKETGISPVEQPEMDIVQIGNGEKFIFTAKVTVQPEVELGQYKEVEVEKQEARVTDEDVDNELKAVAERNSRLITVEEDRGLEKDDIAFIDFEGFVDGEAFEGGKAEDHQLTIGSGQFIPGFEDQLIGKKADEDVEVSVKFPEDYQSEDLAGKDAVFKVKVKLIKVKELPELDDEFAKDVSEFDTLDEYREDLREKALEREKDRVKSETESRVVKAVVDNAKVDIPQVMVENRIDGMMRDLDMRLRYQGMGLEKYVEMTGNTEEELRKQFAGDAKADVKSQLVLEAISNTEDIPVPEEKIDEEIKRMADNYKQEAEDFKKHLKEDDIEYIKGSLKIQETVSFLVESAKIK